MSYHDQKFSEIDSAGLTLIEGINQDEGGSNGAGKSSLWDGISWALFAQTVRGLKGNEVVNRKYAGDCSVVVQFGVEGRNYTVTRYRQHSDMGDRLSVVVDGRVVELGTTAQTQEWLERELGVDFELFRCTVLFAQGETFDFVSAGNKPQKEILSKVMRIDYETYQDRAKAKFKELSNDYVKVDRDIEVLTSHILESPEDAYKAEIEEWDRNRDLDIAALTRDIKALAQERKKIVVPDTKALEKTLEGISVRCDAIKRLEQKVNIQRGKYAGERHVFTKQLAELEGLKGSCPTCRQEIDSDVHTGHLDKLRSSIANAKVEIAKYDEQLAKLDKQFQECAKEGRQVQSLLSDAKALESEVRSLKHRAETMVSRINELKAEPNPYHMMRDNAIEKQRQIEAKLEKLEAKKKEINDMIPYYEFWVNAFGDAGIKSFVFDLVCSTLTNKANTYLNTLTSGTVSVAFDTQKKLKSGEVREKFDCTVLKDGEGVKFESYSGGEKRRISLAVDMALSDLMSDYHGSRFNVVVFDEQTTGLDFAGRQAFMELLKKLALTKRVFVVDHDAEFKTNFDSVWTVTKKDGVSKCLQ